MIWRPVLERLASGLAEIRTVWTVEDLIEAHRALDAKAAIEAVIMEESKHAGSP